MVVLTTIGMSVVEADIPQSEREALITFYNSTNGDNWYNNTNWLGAPGTECTWYGVNCNNDETHVRALELNWNNLAGPLPVEIANLTELESLELNGNYSISGPIPTEIGTLSQLQELYLTSNQFTGTIPSELSNCSELAILNLGSNQLTGRIPSQLGGLAELFTLDLYQNDLGGPIPLEVAELPNIKNLRLQQNQLSGSIPSQLSKMAYRLENLDLRQNQFTGNIPSELGQLHFLKILYLSDNQLTGKIPSQLANPQLLKELGLSGNSLSGKIPSSLGNCQYLEMLDLGRNELTGTLPITASNFPSLRQLYVSENQLSGGLPPQFQSGIIYLIYLYDNQFSGPVPSEWGSIESLEYLKLYSNELTGPIPSELGDLSILRLLQLYDNHLSGPIPSNLGNLSYLQFLDLKGNMLTGAVPTELQNLGGLYSFGLNLTYNALHTDDPDLREFINNHTLGSFDFGSLQTVAPDNMAWAVTKVLSGELSWDIIQYDFGDGGYIILLSTTSGGPYYELDMTADKEVDHYVFDCLAPGTTYYAVIKTATYPHQNNRNTVISETSEEVSATTPGVRGDLDANGIFNAADVQVLADFLVENRTDIPNCLAAGDLNGDLKVNIVDLNELRRMLIQ